MGTVAGSAPSAGGKLSRTPRPEPDLALAVVRFLDRIDHDAIKDLLKRDEYFWLDLTDPGADRIRELGEVFSFHPLAVEDMAKRGQRPKLDDFGEDMFLVYYGVGLSDAGEVELEEVHACLSGGFLVTVHEGDCKALAEA